jgi:hypothetical protein
MSMGPGRNDDQISLIEGWLEGITPETLVQTGPNDRGLRSGRPERKKAQSRRQTAPLASGTAVMQRQGLRERQPKPPLPALNPPDQQAPRPAKKRRTKAAQLAPTGAGSVQSISIPSGGPGSGPLNVKAHSHPSARVLRDQLSAAKPQVVFAPRALEDQETPTEVLNFTRQLVERVENAVSDSLSTKLSP